MSDNSFKFYIQKCDDNYQPIDNTIKDLEADFEGLKYLRCEGIETIGAAKNIYEEKYSDSDTIRSYVPKEITNESTVITLSLVFIGENRHNIRDTFNEYIRSGYSKYWDTARNKWFIFYIKDELPIGESMWIGSEPYLRCDYKLQNIYGKTFNVK